MNELVIINEKGNSVTTSLIVAEIFGKEHKHIIRDIESLSCSGEFNQTNFGLISYTDSMNRSQKAYEMTKDGFSFLVMGYTGEKAASFKERFINEFNKRDTLLKNDDYIISRAMRLLFDRTKSLEQQIKSKDEKIQIQEHQIQIAAPKAEYHDAVLQSEGLIQTNIIAKELGMSAVSLNKILHSKGIIYRCGETWVLYSKYQNQGYTKTRTFPFIDVFGRERTSIHTYWTEKGREFIHSIIKQEKRA